ncbi:MULTISPECIES: aldo/keto reductase [Chryseobacterium]|uniref:Aryl-alcohol dehydrogenase-like predicted oxidoreductase n=1 Tax=Chryseobacterium camelliae TaxID=1265445 RepID=A0ABU0TFR7_9FLAO|nr:MULTISPECIES: aldo/keto reductase [Chryseobacterium]MDT3406296.1 aryl-alcohol dehydrogenase-like predicted oxidoreductase [Pseudacidovorax intermedius]MDQ1095905.1 aryl-alcohol dehydrogenase-like predicted oxidoreductase [Chryseobacterium camelliae]MDQ1099842.1 aryl-alcohol dehydrogenase-like predicted oxidoreductase [Chryseobacterium sp. SORGH_AS_1048]MDR6087188.1 aryl-alcohol dehydrogenase-like predicted oxidoreductase [Chryseobacterium sp. SORGH_AS_0909]MDR6131561.1 aryl-alcohol dehydrog
MNLKQIQLGSQGLIIPQIGLGCMGMTGFEEADTYGKTDETEAIATIHHSLELGGNFLDTADLYGPLKNEQLISKAIGNNRDRYIIATKFGWEIDDQNKITWKINGSSAYVKKAVERSLRNLKTDYIDLYYMHRLDKNIPIEETVGAMSDLVKEGKVKYIGLSEVSSETVRRAHAIHPITAVQSEYSLFERTVEEKGVLKTLQDLGIGFVAYSPLGRGFLSGQIRSVDDLPEKDFRRGIPRFQEKHFHKNIELLEAIETMAKDRQVTSSQLALAWIMNKGIVPIPGTKRRTYLEQNIEACSVRISENDMEKLESILPLGTDTGAPYDEFSMGLLDY